MQENNPRSNVVQVHLVIHHENEDLKIEFEFNKLEDNIDTVVSELIQTLGMTESDKEMIKSLIEQQINPKPNSVTHTEPYFEPINNENQQSDQSDYSSDDSDITDPDYRNLIEQQKQEMNALLEKHLSERKELAQKIQAETMHQQQIHQQQQQQQQQIQQQQQQQQQIQQQHQQQIKQHKIHQQKQQQQQQKQTPQQQQQQQPIQQPPIQQPQSQTGQQPQPQIQQQPPPPNSVQPNPPIVINPGQQTQQTPSASPMPLMNSLPANNPPTNSVCDDLIDFK